MEERRFVPDSSKARMYDTVEEIRQKIDGSVVLYDGYPVRIFGADGSKSKLVVHCMKLPLESKPIQMSDNGMLHIPASDSKWDFKSLGSRLGYVQTKGPLSTLDSVFVSRVPVRRSRQGLDTHTTTVISPPEWGGYRLTIEQLMYQPNFVNTMMGSFPKSKEAFNTLINSSKIVQSVPISRKLAMSYDRVSPPVLLYRTEKVGYTEDGTVFKIAEHKKYLTETLVDMEGLKVA